MDYFLFNFLGVQFHYTMSQLISTKKAAELCGMPTSSFRYKAKNYKI